MPVIIEELIVESDTESAGRPADAAVRADPHAAVADELALAQQLALLAEREARLRVD